MQRNSNVYGFIRYNQRDVVYNVTWSKEMQTFIVIKHEDIPFYPARDISTAQATLYF